DRSAGIRAVYIGFLVDELTRSAPPPLVAPERLVEFMAAIATDRSFGGAQALAWYYYNKSEWLGAVYWFKAGLDWAAEDKTDDKISDKAIEGYALTLYKLGRLEEAENILYDARERSPLLRARYIDIVAEALSGPEKATPALVGPRLNRFSKIVEADHSAKGAQALAWYRFGNKDWAAAVQWFADCLDWSPEAQADVKINEGYALALKGVGRFDEAEALAYAWRDRAPSMRAAYTDIVVEELTTERLAAKLSEERVDRFAEIVRTDSSAKGAQAIGWFRYGQTGCGYAVDWFRAAIEWSPDRLGDIKINEGYAAALRGVGRFAEAEAVAYGWVDKSTSMRALYVDIMVEELTRHWPRQLVSEDRVAKFAAVITPLRSNLGAQALGWYRYERSEYADAAKWFRAALEWWPGMSSGLFSASGNPVPITAALMIKVVEGYFNVPLADGGASASRSGDELLRGPEAFAKTWEGYALALRALGRVAEAEAIAYAWRERSPALRALLVEIAIAELTTVPAPAMAAERLAGFIAIIRADRAPAGAQALAWYHAGRKEWGEAADWFKATLDWEDGRGNTSLDAKIVEGYGLALRNLGRFEEAQDLALAWLDRVPALETVYVGAALDELRSVKPPAAVSADRLSRLLERVTAARSAEGAQALGWYFYGQSDVEQASAWFKSAMSWAPGGKSDPKAMEGYALALRGAGKSQDALTLAADWRERSPEMASLYVDLATSLVSKDHPPATSPPELLAKADGAVLGARSAPGAATLGWYRLEHKEWALAAQWFKNSMAWSTDGKGDAKSAEGSVIALRNLGRSEEAEAIASAWADRDDAMRSLYVDTVAERLSRSRSGAALLAADDLKRFGAAVLAANSANGAQALGWYSYNNGQFRPAAAWFGKAVTWDASEGSALGLALSFRRLADGVALVDTIDAYRDRFPRLAELLTARGAAALSARRPAPKAISAATGRPGSILAAYNAKDYARCISLAESKERDGALAPAESLVEGWCLLAAERPQEAAAAFDRALASTQAKQREDAGYGKSLALLRNGVTEAAALAASQAPLSTERRNEIGVLVLTQRAQAAFNAKRYEETLDALARRDAFATEQRDLTILRGWALYHLGRYEEAQRAFAEADRQLSTQDSQAGLAAVEGKLHRYPYR
ncbi:MAG: hypothetical protein JOZ40_14555, partial [Methylobacteriaceae bacterium]|nr:hypothetical protein [Methylobacteriaceae bacterium]